MLFIVWLLLSLLESDVSDCGVMVVKEGKMGNTKTIITRHKHQKRKHVGDLFIAITETYVELSNAMAYIRLLD